MYTDLNMNAESVLPRFAVVEDDPSVARLIQYMLSDRHGQVECFALGADLLKSEHLSQFQTILLDLSLPDIDGFELMDLLAARYIGLSILIISGHADATLRAAQIYGKGAGLNVRGVLCKPFSKADLLNMLGLDA